MTRWVQLDGSWHLIQKVWVHGNGWLVQTHCCNITRSWDQTFLDRLPGGSETVCDRIGPPVPEPKAGKKTRKAK